MPLHGLFSVGYVENKYTHVRMSVTTKLMLGNMKVANCFSRAFRRLELGILKYTHTCICTWHDECRVSWSCALEVQWYNNGRGVRPHEHLLQPEGHPTSIQTCPAWNKTVFTQSTLTPCYNYTCLISNTLCA